MRLERWIPFALVGELFGVYALRLPLIYNFNNFAFWDWGGYLVAHDLVIHGRSPIIDFGWQYGLLPLFMQEVWFKCAGASPESFLAISLFCSIWLTVVLGRFARDASTPGRWLIILSLPLVVALGGDLPHELEPALLATALLAQIRRRRDTALALATVAAFTKPTMAYLYGGALIAWIARDVYRDRWPAKRIGRELAPAIIAAGGILPLLAASFGWSAIAQSLWPSDGARAYRILHYGWGGAGRGLFYFPGIRPAYYIGTPVTFWLLGTLALTGGAAWLVSRGNALRQRSGSAGIVITCAALQLGFISLFYGAAASWTYYAYILVIGLAVMSDLPGGPKVVASLCVLAALANFGSFKAGAAAWREMIRTPDTAGLFASVTETAEWRRTAALAAGKRTVACSWVGAAGLLIPWVERPEVPFLVPGVVHDAELRVAVAQLEAANLVIVPTIPGLGNPLDDWPGAELRAAVGHRSLLFNGRYFQVLGEDRQARALSHTLVISGNGHRGKDASAERPKR